MILTFEINEVLMGDEITLSSGVARHIKARVIANEHIKEILIIRNGEEVNSTYGQGNRDVSVDRRDTEPLDGLALERELTDERFAYYYLRVESVNGGLAWASPIWVHIS